MAIEPPPSGRSEPTPETVEPALPQTGTPEGRSADTQTRFSVDEHAAQAKAEPADEPTAGVGPYRLALRRLRRNKVALAFGVLFLVVLILCLLAPVYSHSIAHIGPNEETTGALDATGQPIGPTWHLSHFFLGADNNGRDVAVRLLYGGRNSIEIGVVATLITMILSTVLGLVAGYTRGFVDGLISRIFDVIWSYPAILLGIALGTALALKGIGPIHGNSLFIPAFIIGFVYVPYVGKPIRGQALQLREREFVDAARAQGMGPVRIMFTEVLPNLASTIIVFLPLAMANAILLEAGLSYVGAGVQPPNPSWGTMISDGVNQFPGAFHETLVPGIMLVLCVLGINVFGDGVRDAIDPRAQVRIEH